MEEIVDLGDCLMFFSRKFFFVKIMELFGEIDLEIVCFVL